MGKCCTNAVILGHNLSLLANLYYTVYCMAISQTGIDCGCAIPFSPHKFVQITGQLAVVASLHCFESYFDGIPV